MSQKLIADCRIKYCDRIYEKGNTFLCLDDHEAAELIKNKMALPYPEPSPEVLARKYATEQASLKIENSYLKQFAQTYKNRVSIITAIKDNLKYLKRTVEAVYLNTGIQFEYIIIDNGSGPEVKEYLLDLQSQKKNLMVITNAENRGYAYACNQGIKMARYNYLCMLDADTYVAPGWLRKMLRAFEIYPDCGIVSPGQSANTGAVYIPFTLRQPENIQDEITEFANSLPEEFEEKQIFQIYGFCHLVKKDVYNTIGVYDWKRYLGMASNETDLFWRAGLKGFKLYWAKGAYVYHYHNKIKQSLGQNPKEMCEKGHEVFAQRQKRPDTFYVKNDSEINANIDLAYMYNKTYQDLKPFFNE